MTLNSRDRTSRLNAIVHTYMRRIRPRTQAEIDWFAHQHSLHAAIRNAALAVNSRGKRYSHQRRLTKLALERAFDVLSKHTRTIEKANHFGDLIHLIDAALEPIPGLGEIYVYDTSLRVGAKLNLFPDKVYLHAGTRLGARALGLRAATALDLSDVSSF